MPKVSNCALAAGAAISAALLSAGNLMLVNSFAPQYFNAALCYIIISIVIAAAAFFAGHKRLVKAAPYLLGLLLLSLIFPLFNNPVNGTCRWIRFSSFAFSPAILTMPILCLWSVYIREKRSEAISNKDCFFLIAGTVITAGLVLLEPFYSMGGFIIVLGVVMVYLTGYDWKKITNSTLSFLSGTCITCAVFLCLESRERRTAIFRYLFDPDQDLTYHTWVLLKILKKSVFWGPVPVSAGQTPYHIPNAINDSALIAGCGKFGYVFLIAALLLTAVIIVCGTVIARRSQNTAARMLAGGMTAVLAIPALVHTLMMFGLLPVGSVAFPFLSYGANTMIANVFALSCIVMTACKQDTGKLAE